MSKMKDVKNKNYTTYAKIEVKSNLFSLAEKSVNPPSNKDDMLPTLQVKKMRVKTRGH